MQRYRLIWWGCGAECCCNSLSIRKFNPDGQWYDYKTGEAVKGCFDKVFETSGWNSDGGGFEKYRDADFEELS